MPQDGCLAKYPHCLTMVPKVSWRVHSQESIWQIHLSSLIPWSRAGSNDRLGRGEDRWRRDVAPFCSLSNASRYCWQGVHPKPCSCSEGLSSWTGQRIPWENCFRLPGPKLHCIYCTLSRGKENRGRKFILRTFFRAGVRVIVCQMGNLYAGQCFSLNTVLFSSHSLLSLAWYL